GARARRCPATGRRGRPRPPPPSRPLGPSPPPRSPRLPRRRPRPAGRNCLCRCRGREPASTPRAGASEGPAAPAAGPSLAPQPKMSSAPEGRKKALLLGALVADQDLPAALLGLELLRPVL